MKKVIIILTTFFLLFELLISNEHNSNIYDNIVDQLVNLEPDNNNIFRIQNLFLEKEGSAFMFEEGEFHFFKSINNRVRVGVFIGEGVFSFTPPINVEKRQLESYTGSNFFEREFNTILFFFSDSTYEFVRNNYNKIIGKKAQEVKEIYQSSLKYICDTNMKVIINTISSSFVNKDNNRMFIAQLNDELLFAKETFYWLVDPFQKEEISFFKTHWLDRDNYNFELVTRFDWPDDYPENNDLKKEKICISSYNINCTISDSLKITYETTMEFYPKTNNIGWLPFEISERMIIDSIVNMSGKKIEYCHKEKYGYLLINYDDFGLDSTKIRFFYHDENQNIIQFRSSEFKEIYISIMNYFRKEVMYEDFFPKYTLFKESNFHLTFNFPQKYRLCTIGKKLSENIKDSVVTSTWVTEKKISNLIYCIGEFSEKTIEADSVTPNVIFYYKNPFFVDSVLHHIKESYIFYTKLFGKCKTNIIYAVEIPGNVSYAFDGLIALSNTNLKDSTRIIFDESSCTHEIAHQWWGIDIGRNSYRDTWISEGLSEYCRLLYKKNYLKDINFFYAYLNETRKFLIKYKSTLIKYFGENQLPISLGYRSAGKKFYNSYYVNIYIRGAWIFHMLNSLLTNVESGNETFFIDILKDFYQTFKGQDITMNDFIYIVNKHADTDLSWFFHQWVDINEIPYYIFGYKKEKTFDGTFKVTCRIKQLNVPDDFKVSLPTVVNFDNQKFKSLRINVTQPFSEFEFPLFSLEPKDIQLNIYQSVLCDIETNNFKRIDKHTRPSLFR